MTFPRHLVGLVIFAAANFAPPVPAVAEGQSQFARVVITGMLSIEIPRHWEALDAASRANLATLSESITGSPPTVASLAVSARPAPAGAIIRVTRLKNDGPTQRQLSDAAKANPHSLLRDLANELQIEFAQMEDASRKLGMEILEKPRASLASIDGRTALLITYKRSGAAGGPPFFVRQFHVPLETAKALITVSHRETDAILFKPILEHVLQSIDFDIR